MTSPQILIVEDDALVALGVEMMLDEAGYAVLGTVTTASEVLEFFDSNEPDLVLMDINLGPGGNGIDIARGLADRYGTRVLYVTAQSDPATMQRAMATDPLGILLKPYRPEQLQAAVAGALTQLRGTRGDNGAS